MMNLLLLLLSLLANIDLINSDTVLWESNDGIRLTQAANATLVNNRITGFQNRPKVTQKGNGNFTILWTSNALETTLEASLYNDAGEVLIKDTILHNGSISHSPAKTDLLGGGLFLAWSTGDGNIFAKIYDQDFQLVNDTFVLNQQPLQDTTAYNVMLKRIASGNVVATWQVVSMGNEPRPLYMTIVSPQGKKLLNDTEITGATGDFFDHAYIVPLNTGDFLIVLGDVRYIDNNNNFDIAVMGIVYDANGTIKHNLFKIANHNAFNQQIAPKATILSNNGFVTAWRTVHQVYYRVYNSSFSPITDLLNLTTTNFSPIFGFDINSIDHYGGFLVAWDGYLPNTTNPTVWGQFVYPNGSLLGPLK